MSTVTLESGQTLVNVHEEGTCWVDPCCIHTPSNHSMSAFPRLWRDDWGGMMERTCPHGIGHPDPDWLAGKNPKDRFDVHGCDGCCR
jgi:hypothetical protein